MRKLQCDICGGKILVQAGAQIGECENCGAGYTLERMRELVSGVKVSMTGTQEDVEQWKKLVNTYIQAYDYESAERIIKKILEALPEDDFANDIYKDLQERKFFVIKNGVLVEYTGKAEDVIIPDGIKSIAKYAFKNCDQTKSIVVPDSVMDIGVEAFSGCTSLREIRLPNGIAEISEYTFSGCHNLQSIILPDGIERVGSFGFSDCYSLQNIVLPNSIILIGQGAFRECRSLQNVILPNNITDICDYMFIGCTSLQSVILPDSVKIIGREAFAECTNLLGVAIPSGLTYIGAYAFRDCQSLWDISIPQGVIYGGLGFDDEHPFDGCTTLEQIKNYRYKQEIWRKNGLCQYCGGTYKGWSKLVCKRCGKEKDY